MLVIYFPQKLALEAMYYNMAVIKCRGSGGYKPETQLSLHHLGFHLPTRTFTLLHIGFSDFGLFFALLQRDTPECA